MSFSDFPPSRNFPPPPLSAHLKKAVESVGGKTGDGGLSFLRIVWGQDPHASYVYNGERHLSYRHHIHREEKLACPEYDLAGKVAGVRVFGPGDVIPANCLLAALVEESDVGINRWFAEQALPVSAEEWEAQRWEFVDGELADQMGPYPEGGVVYDMLYCVAAHSAECCGGQASEKACYGRYREPDQRDVAYLKALWQQRLASTHTHGWRERASETVVKREAASRKKDALAEREKQRAEVEDSIYQELLPFSKRYTSEGSGPDLFKYIDLGSPTATSGDNQARRKFPVPVPGSESRVQKESV
jgi:hypothetical protein